MVFLSGSIYKTFTWQSQTILAHFSVGHIAVKSQTSINLVQKTVCVFVKRKCGLNEDLHDSEQFTYNVLCNSYRTINDITALLVAHELLHPTVSETKTRQSFNSKLELNISTLDWPVWDVFITLYFRQLNIRRKQ